MSTRRSSRLCVVGVLYACGWALALLGVPSSALAAAPVIEEEWVTEVSATSATLWAKVNPEGEATGYRFEYDTDEYSSSAVHGKVFPAPPTPEGDAGSGNNGVIVHAHPQDFTPGTPYHFRVVATNSVKPTPEVAYGMDQSLMTQPAAGALELPDGRRWELVSPAIKDGASIEPSEEHGGVIQAAENGGAITYLSIGPVESPGGNSNVTQVLSVRGDHGGWLSQDIATPHDVATGVSTGSGQEYRYFSPELSVGLVEPLGSGSTGSNSEGAAPLSPGASEKTVYVRADAPLSPEKLEQGVYGEAAVEGGYLPLVTGCPVIGECASRVKEDANVPLGTIFGGKVHFEGATPDVNHVLLASPEVPLTEKTPEGKPSTSGGLYEWTGGRLQLVSMLPTGEQASETALGNDNSYNARGAISNDGMRIVFSVGKRHLYMRSVSIEKSVQLDAPEASAPGGEGQAEFQFASGDGSKVFFTDEAELTGNSSAAPGRPDLYECEMIEVGNELKCTLRDLTVDPHYNKVTNPRENADVEGVVMAGSDNSSYLYFVGEGELTATPNAQGEKAKAGKGKLKEAKERNLYMLHYDEAAKTWDPAAFVARLAVEDAPDWGTEVNGEEPLKGVLQNVTSRVSPDGQKLTFMSERELTGYDNVDVSSGVSDEEIYLYSAPPIVGSTGQLVCVSCNPTGERPAGVLDSTNGGEGERLLIDKTSIWATRGENESGRWLAGSVPGWTAMETDTARYQPRYLADDGRVFFDSSDGLVPQDTNRRIDVYEYEPVDVGNCTAAIASAGQIYVAREGGCVGLVSSGNSRDESVFLDASESGEDVFFLTSAPLVAGDRDTAFDVYDSHVCSTAEPCSTGGVVPSPCTTVDACRPAPVSQPAVYGAPSSATFNGTGNITFISSGGVVSKRGTRAQELARALRACHKMKKRKQRQACDRKARRRYASKATPGRGRPAGHDLRSSR